MNLYQLTLGVLVALSCMVVSSKGYPLQDLNVGSAELHRTQRLYEDPAHVEPPRELRRFYAGIGRKSLLTGLSLLDAQEELMDDLNDKAEETVRGTFGRGLQAVRNSFRSGQLVEDANEMDDEELSRERRYYTGIGLNGLNAGLSALNDDAKEKVNGDIARGFQAVRNRFRPSQLDQDSDEIENEIEDEIEDEIEHEIEDETEDEEEISRERRYYPGIGRIAIHTGLSLLDNQEELLDDLNDQANEKVRGTLARGWQAARNRFRSIEDADDIEDLYEDEDEEV